MIPDEECARCGAAGERAWYEVTTFAERVPRHLPGLPWSCTACGGPAFPVPIDRLAPVLGPLQDVAIPTPDDLLVAAGLPPRWGT